MTTYTKINLDELEVEEQISDKSRYSVSTLRSKIASLQAELTKLQAIEAEAVKLGI